MEAIWGLVSALPWGGHDEVEGCVGFFWGGDVDFALQSVKDDFDGPVWVSFDPRAICEGWECAVVSALSVGGVAGGAIGGVVGFAVLDGVAACEGEK